MDTISVEEMWQFFKKTILHQVEKHVPVFKPRKAVKSRDVKLVFFRNQSSSRDALAAGCTTGWTNYVNDLSQRAQPSGPAVARAPSPLMYNRLHECLHDATRCRAGCTTGCIVYKQLKDCRGFKLTEF